MQMIPPEQASDRPHKPEDQPSVPRRRSQRLQRIRDYQQQALVNPDPLAANLGAMNADLMRIEHRLLKATNETLARSASPLEDFPALLPALNVGSQLARQIHRLAEFERKLQDSSANTAAGAARTTPGQRQAPADAGPAAEKRA